MISKRFYLQLIVRITLLTIFAMGLAFSWFTNYTYLVAPIGLFILVQVVAFITYFNQTNRKIAYLFESIKNEDFTFQFPEQILHPSFKRLHQSLNQVNERIREKQQLQQIQEQYYQEILETAAFGIFTANSKGHILFANPTARKLLNLERLSHLRQLEKTVPHLYDSLKGLQAFDRQLFKVENERSQIQILVKATQIVLHKDPTLLIVIQNINPELDHQETESWSKLIRVMTHEIMNTIAPITSVSDSILKHFFNDQGELLDQQLEKEQAQTIFKGLQIIKEQSHGLTNFVQSYRSLLNIPQPTKTIIQVPELLDKIHLMMSEDLQSKQIQLELLGSHQSFEIFADEQQITQVLVNLIKNAIQASKDKRKGKIKIDFGQDQVGQKFLQIQDNGSGIAPETMDQIFIPFFTTKATGTGTGLSLVKQIMSLHGGRIEIHSEANAGATFTLFF